MAQKRIKKLLFGTDPEMFAVYEKDGVSCVLPPYFLRENLQVPSDKTNRKHPVFIKGDSFVLHEDGAAFEMSIKPSFNPKDLFDSIQQGVEEAHTKILSQFPEYCSPYLQFLPTVAFEVDRWKSYGKDFRMSTTFGCDPDFDAFNSGRRAVVSNASLHPERYGGGHIHISGSSLFEDEPIKAIKCLAITVGNASVANSQVPDLERRRTFLYGMPGKFRIQKYKENELGQDYQIGIEYRTPSNSWAGDWKIAEEVFKWATIGVQNLLETDLGSILISEVAEESALAILECNQEKSRQILDYVLTKI
jgi:hypothetical protein